MADIPTRYNPKETEDKWYRYWEEKNLFSARPNPHKKPFCIVIPPPNVTGILHMGHALNNTIQDILIRYHRMKGDESLWMPGTDHAGIATQNVVEKKLAKEGLKRQDLGREKFIDRVWQWREEYGSTIIRQLKKLGASCDWGRLRFTMDQEYSRAVREAFVQLWSKKPSGLIYQDDKVINWCPRCQTALSDEEAPHRPLKGNLYYMRYPLKQGLSPKGTVPAYVVVATTRPETMLGDTAVAVNPNDKRYKKLIGTTITLPLVNREIKIISDSMVDMKFGTGAVKVTPAHDPNDYLLGKKHNLSFVNVMYPDGRMNENAGDYKDMDRFEAREVILEDLKQKGLLDKVQPHELSAGHCYRCHTIIEPYLSKQWFVKMKPLAKPAIEAVKNGRIKFHPKRWTKVYLNWMENIQDWCISRQIWWGHRIPLWYCRDCQKLALASIDDPKECPICKSANLKQDEDVLDTWFSSWLWPFATFGWPFEQKKGQSPAGTVPSSSEDLSYFYPTSVLVTAPEIIFFWVARMIMAGMEFIKEIPFKDVYIHGTVRDIEGKKMSKSLGNIIDPLDIIAEYGADALRFSLISITAQGQDVFLSKERFEQGRNFANKIWNASRFIMMNLEQQQGQSPAGTVPDLCVFFSATRIGGSAKNLGGKKEGLGIVNRWILSRFYSVLKELDRNLAAYKFNEAANLLYGFFWHEFCDWYLEMIKSDIGNKHNQVVMYKVLEKSLRVLHPFMPFITEELWQRLQGFLPKGTVPANSIMIQPWPHIQEQIIDKKAETQLSSLIELITAIRNIRQELEIPAQGKINARIFITSSPRKELLQKMAVHIRNLAGVEELSFARGYKKSAGTFETVLKDMHIVIHLSGATDVQKHKHRLQEKIKKLEAEIRSKEKLLGNRNFVEKAPGEIIESEKAKLKELRGRFKKMEAIKDGLR
ncbi:MAG: valine--tRNA ligase [Candidatus Omnitrophica bacterium]|nr:valine--tRNA ligase [Candidatus Omnitrophota bacterium]MBL7210435.1 valine--tRNA ligase [Candidatus Omnitrophota bacterium]